MEYLSVSEGILLFIAALVAGWIDSIAGGGGLITLPSLLAVGLPPHLALGTNKLQSSFGSLTATLSHWRNGVIQLREAKWGIFFAAAGAASGAWVVQRVSSDFLDKVIPFLLLALVIYFIFSPRLGTADRTPKITPFAYAVTAGFAIAFYDGFFGPGTGSFFVMTFMVLLGYNMVKATGYTKLLNFVSNILSLLAFAIGGQVVWIVGLTMAGGQVIGAYLGSHLVISRGAKLIRPIFIVVVLMTTAKLFYDNFK